MRYALLLLLSLLLCSCSSNKSPLSSTEQLQSLIVKHVISGFLDGEQSTGPDDFRLFLSTGNPWADPSPAVLAQVTGNYLSARPYSLADPSSPKVFEQGTLAPGAIIWVSPIPESEDGPFEIEAGYHAAPLKAADFRYRVQRIKGVWRILDCRMMRIT